jgi:hypothetical protein
MTSFVAGTTSKAYFARTRRGGPKATVALMDPPSWWSRGEEVVWRSLPGGSVGFVCATRVLLDGPVVVALYQPTGSTILRRAGHRGGPGGRLLLDWNGKHRRGTWEREPTLRVHPVGERYSVVRTWDTSQERYRGWYVNLEQDWRRTPIGFDSRDDILDVVVADDLSGVSPKDDDELFAAVKAGQLSLGEAEEICTTAEQVMEALSERAWPFTEDYWAGLVPTGLDAPVEVPEDWDCLYLD